jgi:radical SAM protein with 4Fe4S-binding SPASM domain
MFTKRNAPATVHARSRPLVLSSPVFFALEITSACNNHCPGCCNVFMQDRALASLSAAQWEKILTALGPHIRRLKLTGGEPTLHPEFETIIATLRKLDISFALFTNARWCDPAHLIAFLKAVPQCRGMLVSLHGSTAVSHDAFTGVPGSFAETCTNVRHAAAAGLTVTTSTVITAHNWRDIGDIAHLSRELGANYAVFNRYLGKPLPQVEPSDAQLHKAIETIENLRHQGERIKFGNCIPQCFHPSSSTGCLAGVAYCTVDPWGNVRPCNHAPLLCGNLLERSIEEIWHGEAMSYWQGMIAGQCWHCLRLPNCHGGCRAMAMIRDAESDPLMRDPILEEKSEPLKELILYEEAHPIKQYELRAEDFGYVLMRGNCIVPVTAEVKPILDACDGRISLLQLQERFGQGALDFVGSLIKKGLIKLQSV